MPIHNHSLCKTAQIHFTSPALQLGKVIIFHSSHLDTIWEYPLKHTPSLLLELGLKITIHISLHWLHLFTAVARRADSTHTYKGCERFSVMLCECKLNMTMYFGKISYMLKQRLKKKKNCRKRAQYLCVLHMRHSTLRKGTQSSCSSVVVHPSLCIAGRRGWFHTHSNRSASCASAFPLPQCIHQQRWSAWTRHYTHQQRYSTQRQN